MKTHRFVSVALSVLAGCIMLFSAVAPGHAQPNAQTGTQVFLPMIPGQTTEAASDAHHNQPDKPKPAIILVHGAWADGTGWQHVIPLLERAGYSVTAVQNPLASFADDVATTKRVIDAETLKGPVVVVGHSYGGAVITEAAAGNPNVKALVYIAAFAPEVGEPLGVLLAQYPTELGTALVPDAAGFLYLDRTKFREIFAADVDRTEARVMAVAQKPISAAIFGASVQNAAWHTIPAWYMVATEDKALSPDLERFVAQRMNAKTVEIRSSHVAFISHPEEVFKLIDKAAKATVK